MFESHVTVVGMDDAEFIVRCRAIQVKPVVIEDDTGSGRLRQTMTCKFHFTDDLQIALSEMHSIASRFEKVARRKLEYIVRRQDKPLPDHLYLEYHTKYDVSDTEADAFVATVLKHGGHVSRNNFKPGSREGRRFWFATVRHKESWSRLLRELAHYERVNSIQECVVYDDAPDIDSGWYGCDGCELRNLPRTELEAMLQIHDPVPTRSYRSWNPSKND